MTGAQTKTAQTYDYRPAPIATAQRVVLDGTTLSGDDWTLDLADVTAASFANHVMRGSRMIRLDLWAGDDKRSLGYAGANTGWRDDPDARIFLAMLRDVLTARADANAEAEVALGEIGRTRLAMFAVGIVSALAGVGIFIAALATGVSGDKLIAGAVPMVLLGLLGAVMMRAYWPWRKPAMVRAAALADVIDGLLADLAGQDQAGG